MPTGDLIDIGEPITIKQSTTRCRQSLIEDDKVELPQELVAMVEYLKERGDKTENLFQVIIFKNMIDRIRLEVFRFIPNLKILGTGPEMGNGQHQRELGHRKSPLGECPLRSRVSHLIPSSSGEPCHSIPLTTQMLRS